MEQLQRTLISHIETFKPQLPIPLLNAMQNGQKIILNKGNITLQLDPSEELKNENLGGFLYVRKNIILLLTPQGPIFAYDSQTGSEVTHNYHTYNIKKEKIYFQK